MHANWSQMDDLLKRFLDGIPGDGVLTVKFYGRKRKRPGRRSYRGSIRCSDHVVVDAILEKMQRIKADQLVCSRGALEKSYVLTLPDIPTDEDYDTLTDRLLLLGVETLVSGGDLKTAFMGEVMASIMPQLAKVKGVKDGE